MQNTSMPSSEQTLQGLCAVEVTKTAWFGGGRLPCPARPLSLCGVTRFPRAVGGRWANREKKKKSQSLAGRHRVSPSPGRAVSEPARPCRRLQNACFLILWLGRTGLPGSRVIAKRELVGACNSLGRVLKSHGWVTTLAELPGWGAGQPLPTALGLPGRQQGPAGLGHKRVQPEVMVQADVSLLRA